MSTDRPSAREKLEPVIGCTFESTATDPKEAVKIIWITGEDCRGERVVMVGHSDGVASITMEQWDDWVERTAAQVWADDAEIYQQRREVEIANGW